MNKFLTTSSMETVSRPSTNTFSDHSLSIIHVHKYNNPVNNQNPVSKKIQDTDINRLNNSTINRNKYYYSNNFEHNNGKTVTLKRLISCKSTVTLDVSHFGFKNGGELIIPETGFSLVFFKDS